jgi:beta-glucuronidase
MSRPPILLLAFAACLVAACRPAQAAEPYPSPPSVATLAPTVELRQIGDLLVPFQSGVPLPTYEPQLRPRIDLADNWRARAADLNHYLTLSDRTPDNLAALEREGAGAHRVDYDDRQWQIASLPAVANPPPNRSPTGIWYRKRVSIPPLWGGQRVFLHCLAANYVADLWVNGRYLGYHEGGFTPFSFDITEQAKIGAPNLIVLRVDNPPWLAQPGSAPIGREIVPYGPGDWWNATGVLRDIYLEALPSASLARADVRCEPAAGRTRVEVMVVLRNASPQTFSGQLLARVYPARLGEANLTTPEAEGIAVLRDPLAVLDGKPSVELVIAGNTALAWRLAFATSTLQPWSPDRPSLYVLEVILRDDQGRTVDRLVTQFGLRTLVVSAEQPGLLLNGKRTSLCGINRVEDDPQLGRALTYRHGFRLLLDLRAAKELGANLLRLGHFPNHPLTTILSDRLGLLCWEEIPVLNFDARSLQDQWERRRIARQMFIEMLYQDYNRPSVAFWGVASGCAASDALTQYVRDLADIARFLDGTRLIGHSAAPDFPSPAQAECDVQGLALPPIAEPPADLRGAVLALLDSMHDALPRKPVIVTEFAALAGEDQASWQRQSWVARELLAAVAERPFVAGWAWWSLSDQQTPNGISSTGLLTRDRRTARPALTILREACGAGG